MKNPPFMKKVDFLFKSLDKIFNFDILYLSVSENPKKELKMPEIDDFVPASISENSISIEEIQEMDYMYSVLVEEYVM